MTSSTLAPGTDTDPKPWNCTLQRAVLLVLGIWMAVCGGTLYAFSAFEVELMERCHLSARQLDTVYSFGQLGVGLGIIGGLLHDRCGPVTTCLYGSLFTLLGNLGLDAALRTDGCGGLGTLAMLYFVLQNGSVAIYQVGLFANLRAAPPASQGATAGIVAAGYGLSAAIAAGAYAHAFKGELGGYLRGTAVAFPVTGLAAAVALPRLLGGTGGRNYAYLEEPKEGASTKPPAASGDSSAPSPTLVGRESSADGTVPPSPSKAKADGPSLRTVLRSGDFWWFVATFAQLQAVGSGIFIANLGLIADSLGIGAESRLICVRMVSYCNCIGRCVAGCILDASEQRGIPRALHTVWTAAILALAATALRFAPARMLPWLIFPVLAVVGFTYGSNWTIMPSFIAQRFNNAHVGVCFNTNACIMSMLVVAASQLAGGLYDQAATSATQEVSQEAGFCRGAHCWRGAFALGIGLSCTGFISAVVLGHWSYSTLPTQGQGSKSAGAAIH